MVTNYDRLKEFAQELDDYGCDASEILKEVLNKERSKLRRVDPVNGDTYWYLDSEGYAHGPMTCGEESHFVADMERIGIGNTFRTFSETVEASQKLRLRHLLLRLGGREKFDPNKGNYTIGFQQFDLNKLEVQQCLTPTLFAIYFDTQTRAKEMVESLKTKRDFDFKELFAVERDEEESEHFETEYVIE